MGRELTSEEITRIEREEIGRDKLEQMRVQALAGRDARTYRTLCDYLGVTPEDTDLIERAETDEFVEDRYLRGLQLKEKMNVLSSLRNAPRGKQIEFLKSLGYEGVKIAGRTQSVSLESAPSKNVYSFYMRELSSLEKEVRKLKRELA